jgi:hypothetical protein
MRDKYKRHKWRVEGIHGEAKTQHGLRRAARRGLENVSIQVYITAAVMNLKPLAVFLLLFFGSCRNGWRFWKARYLLRLTISRIICKWGKICFRQVLREIYVTFSTAPRLPIFKKKTINLHYTFRLLLLSFIPSPQSFR